MRGSSSDWPREPPWLEYTRPLFNPARTTPGRGVHVFAEFPGEVRIEEEEKRLGLGHLARRDPGSEMLFSPGGVRKISGQRQRRQAVLELDEHILLAFVYPARHAIPRLARNLDGSHALARAFVDGKEVPGPVAGLAGSDEQGWRHDHHRKSAAAGVGRDPGNALEHRMIPDGLLVFLRRIAMGNYPKMLSGVHTDGGNAAHGPLPDGKPINLRHVRTNLPPPSDSASSGRARPLGGSRAGRILGVERGFCSG